MADDDYIHEDTRSERAPFLNNEAQLLDDSKTARPTMSRPQILTTFLIFALGVLVGISVMAIPLSVWKAESILPYTPARDALIQERQPLHSTEHKHQGVFWGAPNTAQTKAWEELLQPVMIRAGESELAKTGERPEESVQLREGGYLASLSVFHDLHCLRRIRFWLYRDVFYPNMTIAEEAYEHEHIEHCLEALRMSTMCSGDASLYSFQWDASGQKVVTKSAAERSCIQWESLDRWARGRTAGFHAHALHPEAVAAEP